MIELETGLNITIFNIEKNINLHEKRVSKEEVELAEKNYFKSFFNILNYSLEEFKKIENHLEFTFALEKTAIFFIVIKASQLEELKIEKFNKIIEKIKLLQVKDKNKFYSMIFPIIIDCKESNKRDSCKYEVIDNGYILCKDEKEAKKSIEGILHLFSKEQLFGLDFTDVREFYKNSKKTLVSIYEGEIKTLPLLEKFKDKLLKKFKDDNIKRVIFIISGGTDISLMYVNEVWEEIENYLNIRSGSESMLCGLFSKSNYLEGKVRIVIYGIEVKDGEEEIVEEVESRSDDFQDSDLPDWIRNYK